MSASTGLFLPRWTKRAVMDGSGRDPLGLSRVSDNFKGFLLPSIITTTNRARYYSFYPWALRESLESLADDDDPSDLVEEFRKREAAFAIASKLGKQTDFSIVGIDQVNKHLGEVSEQDSVTTVFRVLPANNWGGFGQYYRGCLQSLGLGGWGEEGFWHASTGRGRKLADAFAHSVSQTPYSKKRCGGLETVSVKILRDSSSDFSLDGIREDNAKDERILLTRMFLDLDEDAEVHGSSHEQATLGQLLHVLEAYEVIASPPTRSDVAKSCLYWPHYYGCLYGSSGRSVRFAANPVFAVTAAYWRQFCAHQFFTYAVEEVLQAILDAVSKMAEGLTKVELVTSLLNTEFVQEMEQVTGCALSGPAALMRFFDAGKDTRKVQAKFSANHPLAEWWIYSGHSEKPITTRLGRAFLILTQLHAKWRLSSDAALADIAEKAGGEWWLGTCLGWGDRWLAEKHDWATAISDLIDEVYSHHELVRFQKHKLDAAWVEKVGDYYTKLQDLSPEFRSNRHSQAAMILQDLCVLKDGGNDDALLLTSWGRTILRNIIKARS